MTTDFPRPHHGMQSTLVTTLSSGQKVKVCVPRMRACDERNAKGKLCAGHLKRWYEADPEVNRQFGEELYRCERCHTIYLPNTVEPPRTRGLWW
jgi:hypothetical protein